MKSDLNQYFVGEQPELEPEPVPEGKLGEEETLKQISGKSTEKRFQK